MKINRKGFTLIELIFIIMITGVILVTGFFSAYNFYKNVEMKTVSSKIRDVLNEQIDANDVGRGISRARIKANALIFRDGTNYIDNYYYTEVYKMDPVTLEVSSIPESEFYGMEQVIFPNDVTFVIPETIEGNLLVNEPTEDLRRLMVKRIMPKNEIQIIDGNEANFQTIPNDDKQFFRSDFTYGKGYKTLATGNVVDDINYYDIVKGAVPTFYNEAIIQVYYKKKHIGNILINSGSRKFIYIDKRSEG